MKPVTDQRLLFAAFQCACVGAREYLARKNLNANAETLKACLVSWVRIKLPEAMHDAEEALACNMGQAAEATFKASMMQAGIEAAKEAAMPVIPGNN